MTNTNLNNSDSQKEEDPDPKNLIKSREFLYKLIISQLFYDGHQTLGTNLLQAVQADHSCAPSDRLFHLVLTGLEHEPERKDRGHHVGIGSNVIGPGLDLEFEAEPNVPLLNLPYMKLLTSPPTKEIAERDASLMLAKSAPDEMDPSRGEQQGHPVIRTLYDHMEEVTCLEFHPKEPESEPIKALAFHPAGDHMIVATNHPVIRLYDVNTLQCFVCAFPSHQHTQPIVNLKWSRDAKFLQLAAKMAAHDGQEVCSVEFSKNGKYLLSSGKNSICKLWELTTSRCLIAYTGAGTTGKQEYEAQAVFNHTEDYVLFPDEATTSLCAWNSRNASRKQLMSLGHNGAVRLIAHSPTQAAFLTCSDDFRARFWYRRTPTL
ncbi:hypothetical protein NQ317_016000 [Molorchus minor]|uniref:Cleavage stimulation factor 50 kDa subunit n=1 Tax=Molorchus minor TaxID=1323400 RepID=A0ABQ9JKS3_9CUCU|nr:hypothetical protein NQ317_016000 [Molorchus minor]